MTFEYSGIRHDFGPMFQRSVAWQAQIPYGHHNAGYKLFRGTERTPILSNEDLSRRPSIHYFRPGTFVDPCQASAKPQPSLSQEIAEFG